MTYKIVDTNILLLDAHNLVNLGKDGATVVIPETALDEVDVKKSGVTEIAFQAREVGRLLAKATKGEVIRKDNLTISKFELYGTHIEVASSADYGDIMEVEPAIFNDRKIIDVASQYMHAFKDDEVEFLSVDVMCRVRADSLGLKAVDLQYVESIDIEFTKTVEVSDEVFRVLHNSKVLDVDPEFTPNVFNYKFVNAHTTQVKLATLSNGLIQVIGRDTEQELRRQDINPANAEQLFFSKALQDSSISINICEAKAGTGKTALAVSNGIRMVKQNKYEHLVYIRASVDDVDKAEEVGFLSGNDEKMQVYLHPLEDTLDFIVRSKLKGGKKRRPAELELEVSDGVDKLKEDCNIEAMIGLGLRGRTFHNSYVIVDEAQNQSKASLQKMLTRIGQNCKVVIIGSNKQIDNSMVTKYTNGLSVLLEACTKEHDVSLHAVSLPKVLRGPIAQFAEDLYSD